MRSLPLRLTAGGVALLIGGCGTTANPLAGSNRSGRGRVDDPRAQHLQCLRDARLKVTEVGPTKLQIGSLPQGPTIDYTPTPGAAQQVQMSGQVQSAEVIGSALLYPNGGSDSELKKIEDCLAHGVKG